MGADAGGFFGGRGDPLIEGGADAATLSLVLNDDEADEEVAGGQSGGHGIVARQHAVEDEGHVVVLEELGHGEHAFSGFRLLGLGFRSSRGGAPRGGRGRPPLHWQKSRPLLRLRRRRRVCWGRTGGCGGTRSGTSATIEGGDSPGDGRNRGAPKTLKLSELSFPFAGSLGSCCRAGEKELPCLPAGRLQNLTAAPSIADVLFTDANLLLSQFLFYESPSSPISVALGGGSRNGHRTSASVRLDHSVRSFARRFRAPGLRIWKPRRLSLLACLRSVPSHLWLGTGPLFAPLLQHCFSYCFGKSRPIPVSRNFGAWDCKVTPVGCACQERNTTGCIPSNDGLDAGLSTDFPHCGKSRSR